MENIYIDFDSTIFNTDKFYNDFLDICGLYNIDSKIVNEIKKNIFNEEELFDIEKITKCLIKDYSVDNSILDKVNDLYNNNYLYEDVVESIKKLSKNNTLNILTYGSKKFQSKKINSISILNYFKEVIITNKSKNNLDIDYENSIFIDNNPYELKKLYLKNPKKIIRIKRETDKYSSIDTDILSVKEYKNFCEILKYEFGGLDGRK